MNPKSRSAVKCHLRATATELHTQYFLLSEVILHAVVRKWILLIAFQDQNSFYLKELLEHPV